MKPVLLLAGRLGGLMGVLLCLGSAGARLAGRHWLAGFELATLMQAGIAAMVFACLCLLLVLTSPGR